jgi:hypothetical protein
LQRSPFVWRQQRFEEVSLAGLISPADSESSAIDPRLKSSAAHRSQGFAQKLESATLSDLTGWNRVSIRHDYLLIGRSHARGCSFRFSAFGNSAASAAVALWAFRERDEIAQTFTATDQLFVRELNNSASQRPDPEEIINLPWSAIDHLADSFGAPNDVAIT